MKANYQIYNANVQLQPLQPKTFNEVVKRAKVVVELATGVSFAQINQRGRKRELVFARQLFCWLIRKNSTASLSEVGGVFSPPYDHTTIISSCKRIDNDLILNYNSNFKQTILKAAQLWAI